MKCTRLLAVVLALLAYGAAPPSLQRHVYEFRRAEAAIMRRELPTQEAAREIAQAYTRLVAPMQIPNGVARLSNADVAALFDAAQMTQFLTGDERFLSDMRIDLNALERRHAAMQNEYVNFEHALLIGRDFSGAASVVSSHPGSAVEVFNSPRGPVKVTVRMSPVPKVIDERRGVSAQTEFVVSRDGQSLVRRNVDLQNGNKIIVVISPWCHFAQAGIRSVLENSTMGGDFRKAIWLIPPTETDFAGIAQWNRSHPTVQMVIAYRAKEWSVVDTWETPTFYFLKRSRVVATVVGWPPQGNEAQIAAALQRLKS